MKSKAINLNCDTLLSAASMLKVLGHPIRISIVQLLERTPELTVSEIFKALKIEQAIASHHLNTLKNKGILNSQRSGKNTYYSLKHESLIDIVKHIYVCQVP
jgi:DNA-binding transcriptional ArsR family regulator